MKASLSLDLENAEIIKKAIEIDSNNTDRINTTFELDDTLDIKLNANNLSNLRGGLNTIIRLIKVSQSAMRR